MRSIRQFWKTVACVLSLVLFVELRAGSVEAEADPVASVVAEFQEGGDDVVATFAHPFKKGDAPQSLLVSAGGKRLVSQVDVKRRWPDGSIKHAVISALIKDVTVGEPTELEIYGCPAKSELAPAAPALPEGFSAEVVFQFPDGSQRKANALDFLRKALSGDRSCRMTEWLTGPLVNEIQLMGPPTSEKHGTDQDLLVLFGLQVLKNGEAVRVEVVVESPWPDVPGNIPYDVTIIIGGREVLSKKNVGYWAHRMPYWLEGEDRSLGHFAHARWREIYWWPKRLAKTHIRYELPYLVSTSLIPPYDTGLVISDERLERSLKRWEQSPRDILENGIIMGYFPTTGGREDLGPYPTWATRYLLGQDRQAWEVVLGTGDLAGSFPVHFRDRETARIFSIDAHPGFSLNPRGTLEKIPARAAPDRPYVRPTASPYEVDNAHQPSLAFIPYLLTGDYYYLEEMYFWANWCMLIQNAAYRQKEKGLVAPDQIRGEAWALRQLVDAAKIAPDSHREGNYFDSKVKSNLEYYCRFVNGADATPLGTYTLGASDAFVRGRSPQERRKWRTLAPWQQNFLAWSLDHAFRAGYTTAAAPRDYFTGLQVGVLTYPADYDVRYAAPYFLVVGERAADDTRYYGTWKELFEKTFRVVSADTKPGLTGLDYGSSYAYIARAVLLLGVRNEVPGAHEALKTLESYLPQRSKVLCEDPTWAFAP